MPGMKLSLNLIFAHLVIFLRNQNQVFNNHNCSSSSSSAALAEESDACSAQPGSVAAFSEHEGSDACSTQPGSVAALSVVQNAALKPCSTLPISTLTWLDLSFNQIR